MVKICTRCGAKNDFDSKFCSSCGGEFTEEIKPTFAPVVKEDIPEEKVEDVSGRFVVADGGKRFWAYIIDLLITSAVLSAIIGFAGLAAYGDADIFASTSGFYFETFPFSIGSHGIVLFIYFVITEYFLDATIGKSILGIKVIDEEGRSPALVPVIVNSFGKSFGIWFDVIAGWIFVKYEEDEVKLEQRLFQKFAQIVVIEMPKKPSERIRFTNK
ncbi:MAG: RDD family protein [Candidatus Kariarchaeaceae archaeon]|jgi:uncharacterized RDD family membrane protein YckC